MPHLAKRSEIIKGSTIAVMKQKADALNKSGIDIIYLVQGEPDFITPQNIQEAAIRAIQAGKNRYTAAQGLPELRKAISQYEFENHGIRSDPDTEIVVTNGAYQALYLSLLVTIEPNEEVILTDPFFGPYEKIVSLVGGTPVYATARRNQNHFIVPLEELEKAVTKKSKAIILNTPWNPTGTVMSRQELQQIGAFAQKYDLFVIVDEIYSRLIYDNAVHTSLASLNDDFRSRTITVNGFSKSFAMTGWRLGYLIAGKEICGPAARMNHHTGRCATSFVQYAGIEALSGIQFEVEEMIAAYLKRRNIMTEGIQAIEGLTVVVPEGTFYMMVDHTAFGMSSADFALFLLNKAGVVVTPGDYFGNLGKGHIRLSFCNSEDNIKRAIERIAAAVKPLQIVNPGRS